MKIPTNKSINLPNLALGLSAMIVLGGFCYFANISLIFPLFLFISGMYLSFFHKASLKLFLHLGLLLSLIIFVTYAAVVYSIFPIYLIPVACVSMLVILLYNDIQLAFIMSFVTSTLVALGVGNNFNFLFIYFIGGMAGIYFAKDARTRGDLFEAGFFVGLIQALCGILLIASWQDLLSKNFWVNTIGLLVANGIICSVVVLATSRIFEWLFGVLTNFSLLELSDFNQPLLKRMVLEAPGTYHHSLIVSNMAEAAADAIGANSLLTRVGAYYHDVGKLIKPEYFNENQLMGTNKHDHLEPTMSRLVILNHVKEGLELAHKYKLNPVIADFISQHHGTGLIFYFYQRALEGATAQETVDEENFRYPGPRPQSPETALVLLADSVEGAVRSLKEPNPTRIDEVVRKVVNNKFIDGQLDESLLTLKDLELVCSTFSRILHAMYHSRIQYPERKDENERSHKKSSENGSHKSSSTNGHNKKDS